MIQHTSTTPLTRSNQCFFNISTLCTESRMLYNAESPEQREIKNTLTLSEQMLDVKKQFTDLKTKVDSDTEKKINTDAEKEQLQVFLDSHKALDALMGEISGDDKNQELNTYQEYFNPKTGEANIENLSQVEAVHEQIISLIEESKEYAKKTTEQGKEALTEVGKKAILDALAKESATDAEKKIICTGILNSLTVADNTVIKSDFLTGKTLPTDYATHQTKIQNIFTEQVTALNAENTTDPKKVLVFDITEGLVLKTQATIDAEKKGVTATTNPDKTPETTKTPEQLADNAIDATRRNIATYRENAKKQMGAFGWILNMLGIDLGDPTKTGGVYGLLRGMLNVEAPKEEVSYSYENNPALAGYLTPIPDSLNKLSVQKVSLAEEMKKTSPRISANAAKFLNTSEKLEERKPLKNMAEDMLGRFKGSSISSISSKKMVIKAKDAKELTHITTFLENPSGGGSATEAIRGVMEEVGSKGGDLLAGALDSFSGDSSEGEYESAYAHQVLSIREKNEYPEISGYSVGSDNRTISISFENNAILETVQKTFGIGQEKEGKKESTQ